MTDNTQPEALRLANVCSNLTRHSMDAHLIAAELRRQHTRIAELEAKLASMGAGGVQALSAAPEAIAKLRHLYQNMVNGAVRDTASAKRIAEGLLAPAIEALERATPPAEQQDATKAAPGEPYQDSTPHLSVGDSSFESWFGSYCPANKGDKQRARDAYAAGMGDPLVRAAPQQEAQEPSHRETVDVVGVRSNGEHVNLGKIAMPPRMKAREIAIEQFGSFKDDDGSDAEMCFGALEYFLEWLIQQGWSKAPQPAPAPLSDAQIKELIEDGVFLGNCKEIVRAIEQAHGITGDDK